MLRALNKTVVAQQTRPCARGFGAAPKRHVTLASAGRFAAAPVRSSAVSQTVRVGRTLRVSALFGGGSTATAAGSAFYDFQVKDIDGKAVKLDKYKGQVILVVNLASQCGFTSQYKELAEVYNKYNKQGFTILGFPCNQFGKQEPGSNKEIKQFAQDSYGVRFPLFSKVDVNGSAADPLFDWLKKQKGGILTSDIKWNFSKFLLDRNGKVVGRYGSTTTPGELVKDIEKYL